MKVNEQSYRERVYRIVRHIPRGRVMTYGQIAEILGEGYTARTVGYVMHGAATGDVPWQRVINSKGKCSTARMTVPMNLQQSMLEAEGVKFDEEGRCNLKLVLWLPEGFTRDEEIQPSLLT